MSDTRDTEPRTITPGEPPDDLPDDTFHVSSLQPTLSGLSQRRLLNVASIVVAAIVVLALAIHWLPDVLPKPPTAAELQRIHAEQTLSALRKPVRGVGWKPGGPSWAQSIAFTANGALGYVCGIDPSNPVVLFGVYDVHQQTWKTLPTPASGGSDCQVFVSPVAGNYVVLVVDHCLPVDNCNESSYYASRLYDSYDGGETWQELPLPGLVSVYNVAWATFNANFAMYLTVKGNLATRSAAIPFNAPFHLLVSQQDRSFAEITPRQLIGQDMQIGNIRLYSSGTTLYASVDGMSCPSYCTIHVRSGGNGTYWSQFDATYRGSPLVLATAQPYSNTLIGWSFLPQSSTTVVLRSDDNGSSWYELPALPRNPESAGISAFVSPDNTVYAWSYGEKDVIYALRDNATHWQTVAPLPTGNPVAVQVDATGQAVALWGQAHLQAPRGLVYYSLTIEG